MSTSAGTPTRPPHDSIDSDPGHMYKREFVQKGIAMIQQWLQDNADWLDIDRQKPQRILDYACGHGTVSMALLPSFPDATFRGIDISTAQVNRYNDGATRLLGEPNDRMLATQGDLMDPEADFTGPDLSGYDLAVVSAALHHVKDTTEFLERLARVVKIGGTVVVIDVLQRSADVKSTEIAEAGMVEVKDSPGLKIWPGFSSEDMKTKMEGAGLGEFGFEVHPDQVDGPPEGMEGLDRLFFAKGKKT